ncbi:MAG: endonuclease [Bacteroidales bacterium]
MLKRFFTTLAIAFIIQYVAMAQIPVGYYNTATGTGATLKTQLYNIIKGHTDMGYGGLYACYTTTDNLPSGKVWDMYSIKADGTANYWFTNSSNNSDQCGNYSNEGDCYNREHSFCDSWLGASAPQRSDLFHVYPTDGYVNNRRSSYPHGKVGSATWTSSNGSKLGSSDPTTGYTGTVFEPIDSFKGDFARSYFYVATRYENLIAGWSNNGSAGELLTGNAFPAFKPWFVNLMIKWHTQDPVSVKEINRNNAIYTYQHNRNPYIDHPEYVNLVWGGGTLILVNSIVVQGQGGATSISTQGGTLQMSATVLPTNATNSTYTWSVKNAKATISSTGLLTAVADGIDTVVATANDNSGIKGIIAITFSNQGNGVNYIDLSDKVLIYPNPAKEELNIDITHLQTLPENITITDIRGRYFYQTSKVLTQQKINVANLESGMYFVTISGKNCKSVFKFTR